MHNIFSFVMCDHLLSSSMALVFQVRVYESCRTVRRIHDTFSLVMSGPLTVILGASGVSDGS